MGKEKVKKLDAAKRQLDTAIELWFNDGDPISIHTLSCSAHQIVHDINKKTGWRDLVYDTLIIKDEYRKQWIAKMKGTYNFLKHADRDGTDSIELDPATNEFFILFTCFGLELLGEKSNIARAAFTLYQMLLRPEILTEKGHATLRAIPESIKIQALTMKKSVFYDLYRNYQLSIGRGM